MNERDIFAEAMQISLPEERLAFLDRACEGDADLRKRVVDLLVEHEKLGSFLEVPAAAAAIATVERPVSERVGKRIGRYRLLEQIGEGGMGTVWVAEQTEPVKRRVALKLIKPGMDSRQVLSRFEAERQALALMDHPNIAKVYDGGMTEEGRPYFVMEYVKGVPITGYCDNARLSIEERLRLFIPVCQAVQHAHQKGIIHRDLKPSNILVCLYDGQPVPKVIDFGLAKAVHQPLTEQTLYTAHGLMVGTPLYMSPEQAELNNLDVDTRSDVYSLGVILYELLTGSTPLESRQLKEAAFQEILRLIKEVEPQRPSLKLSTSASLPSIAAQRRLEPANLSRVVRGDLDWIVMKSLEKERSRRYDTANGLGRDIERYLSNEPIHARPPSTTYRLRKFAQRNKVTVAAAVVVAASLLVGAGVSTWLAIKAINAEDLAQEHLGEQQKALKEANLAREATARELARAVKAEKEAQSARKKAEANLAKARKVVQRVLTRVSEEPLPHMAEGEVIRASLLEDSLHFYEELLQENDADPTIRFEEALARLRVGGMTGLLGGPDRGEQHSRRALASMKELCREFPKNEQFQLGLADAYHGVAGALMDNPLNHSRIVEAEESLKKAIEIYGGLASRTSENGKYRNRQSESYRWLLMALGTQKPEEALAAGQKGLEIAEQLAKEFPSSPEYLGMLASLHCNMSSTVNDRQSSRNHLEQAAKIFEHLESLSIAAPPGKLEAPYKSYMYEFGATYRTLAHYLADDGDSKASRKMFKKGYAIAAELAAKYPAVPMFRKNLATSQLQWLQLLHRWGEVEEAERELLEVVGSWEREMTTTPELAGNWRILAETCGDISRVFVLLKRWDDAEKMLRKTIALHDRNAARFPEERANDGQKAYCELILAGVLEELNRPEEAEKLYRSVLRLDPKNTSLRFAAWIQLLLAGAHYHLGEYEAAIESVQGSMKTRNGGDSFEWFYLAMASWKLGRKEEAQEWYKKAVAWMDANAPNHEHLLPIRVAADKLLKPDNTQENTSP